MSCQGEVVRGLWKSKVVFFSAFGLVGVGAVIGAGSVYMFYIRNKLEDIYRIQRVFSTQLEILKRDVDKVNQTLAHSNGTASLVSSSSTTVEDIVVQKKSSITNHATRKPGGSRRTVRFRDGYETADDDEYITASSDSDYENEFESVTVTLQNSTLESESDKLDIPTGAEVESWIVEFLKEIDQLLDGDASSQHDAYVRLESSKDKLEHLCGFWWRFAKATHMESAAALDDKEMRKSLVLASCSRAEKALHLSEVSANAHKWFAITLGNKGDFVALSEKIKNGYSFKEHVDRAIQLNPNDPSLYYLLGRFCLEVSQLSWMERKVASTLFASPPTSTTEEALQHFQGAEEASEKLGKPLKDNRLYMAKCYIILNDYERAAHWLKMALDMPNVSSSDKPVHEEALKLFAKYQSYLD